MINILIYLIFIMRLLIIIGAPAKYFIFICDSKIIIILSKNFIYISTVEKIYFLCRDFDYFSIKTKLRDFLIISSLLLKIIIIYLINFFALSKN